MILTSGDMSPEAVKKRADLKKAQEIDSEILTVFVIPYIDTSLICNSAKGVTTFWAQLARLSFNQRQYKLVTSFSLEQSAIKSCEDNTLSK